MLANVNNFSKRKQIHYVQIWTMYKHWDLWRCKVWSRGTFSIFPAEKMVHLESSEKNLLGNMFSFRMSKMGKAKIFAIKCTRWKSHAVLTFPFFSNRRIGKFGGTLKKTYTIDISIFNIFVKIILATFNML